VTALDLDAIKARAELFANTGYAAGLKTLTDRCMASAADVPSLVAVLDDIQAMHHAKRGIYSHVDPGTGDHLGDEPYVICDYDKTPWPCRTQLVLHPESSGSSSPGGQL
jgi:hypothetical protein